MLGAKEIKEIIPHRYPFLLIDRVEEVIEGKSAKGYKNVTINEPFFQGHFPDYPVMPGVLILEALAQLGAVVALGQEVNKGKVAFLVGADKFKWKAQVKPGDRLDLSIEMIRMKGSIGIAKGIATVDGKKACEGEIMFAIG
ncbi:MAG: 3-hydroxyacyl-ACP dehydratase FabZ [Clostridium sp.]